MRESLLRRLTTAVSPIQSHRGSTEHARLYTAEAGVWAHEVLIMAPKTPRRTEARLHNPSGADRPAINPYSTGSTGYSKRIVVTHGQLLGEFTSVSRAVNLTASDRALGVLLCFHSYGLMY